MVVADYAGDLPGAVFVLPEMNELGFANSFSLVVAGMVEAVHADFDGAVSLHGIDLQGAGNEFARCTLPQMFFLTLSVEAALPRVTPP